MASFDFITDERLRTSLEADYAEVLACTQAKSWKAVHVLVGSIIETVLMDYLIATDYKSRGKADPLQMDLGQLIVACAKERVLSDKTVQLASAIKSYRNLIHPGRAIRLEEVADENGTTVARALLEIVVNEVSASKKEQYGYTAEQIVGKLERDASAVGILPHLLKEVRELERERLLVKVIPKRYFELDESLGQDLFSGEFVAETQDRLSQCFRSAMSVASEETKKKVMRNFVAILKEEDQHKVLTYETAFFKASDLKYLPPADAMLVKEHLLSRLSKEVELPLLKTIEGLAEFVASDDIQRVVDPMIRAMVCRS